MRANSGSSSSRTRELVETSAANVIQQAITLLFYEFMFEESVLDCLLAKQQLSTALPLSEMSSSCPSSHSCAVAQQKARQHLRAHEKLLATVCALGGELASGRAQLATDVLEVLVHMIFVHVRHSDATLSDLIRDTIGNLTDQNLVAAAVSLIPGAEQRELDFDRSPLATVVAVVTIPRSSPEEELQPPAAVGPTARGKATPPLPTSGKGWVPKSRVKSAPPPPLE
jgi:hypothetical protein